MMFMEGLFKIVKHSKDPVIGAWKYKSWNSYMIGGHEVVKRHGTEENLIMWKIFALNENKTD